MYWTTLARQVVAMPYNMLLHGPTRESLGISLQNAVVILDEAHNIVDAVNGMHSTILTVPQVPCHTMGCRVVNCASVLVWILPFAPFRTRTQHSTRLMR